MVERDNDCDNLVVGLDSPFQNRPNLLLRSIVLVRRVLSNWEVERLWIVPREVTSPQI